MSLIIEYEGGYPFIFTDDRRSNIAGVFTEFWKVVAEALHTELIFQKEVGEFLKFMLNSETSFKTKDPPIATSLKDEL